MQVARLTRRRATRTLAASLALCALCAFGACSQSHYEGGGRRDDLGDAALGTIATTDAGSSSHGGSSSADGAPTECSAGIAGQVVFVPCP